MQDFNLALEGADVYARALLELGAEPADVAAALYIEGISLSNATVGRIETARVLRELADHLELPHEQ